MEAGNVTNNNTYGQQKLDELAKEGVYNKKDNTITIKDRNNLTQDEYDAILLIATGDQDSYAYAAENQWHAEKYDNWLGVFNTHTIISNAGIGESVLGAVYEPKFKASNSDAYQLQKNTIKGKNNDKNINYNSRIFVCNRNRGLGLYCFVSHYVYK